MTTRRTSSWLPLLLFPLLTDLSCYRTCSEPEGTCGSARRHGVVDPVESVVVCSSDDDEAALDPEGEVRFSGGNCPGETCDFHVRELTLELPEIEMADHVIAAGSVLRLEGEDGRGNADEIGGVNIINTTFPMILEGSIDGTPFSVRYLPMNNVGGAYDSERGILILSADLVPTPSEDAWAEGLPDISFLVTSYDDCSEEAP